MNLADRIGLTFMKQLIATPAGRAHLVGLVADAERNDEGRLFAALEQFDCGEAWFAAAVKKHSADEARHASLLDEQVVKLGVTRAPPPAELNMVRALDDALDGVMSKTPTTAEDVMRAYLVLQVIEERAVSQMPLFVETFREDDPDCAQVFTTLLVDERRHLRWCHAIARRFAPSVEVHDETLTRFRTVEALVFARGTMTNLRYVLDTGLLAGPWHVRLAWRALAGLSSLITVPRGTGFTDLASWSTGPTGSKENAVAH